MIWSKYNIDFYYKNDILLLYNSLYNTYIEIEKNKIDKFLLIKSKLKNNKDIIISNDLKNDVDYIFLVKKNIITTQHEEEAYKKMLYVKKKMQISDPSIRGYTIAPTQDCNFNCEYCFEESRPPIYMDDNTEEQIVKIIKYDKRINSLHIDWYGGEPLMAFDRIESISKKILQIKSIQYSASIITNGYLLTSKIIKKLKTLNITDIQITIDGDEKEHNKRRPLKNGGKTYDTIIKNIENFYAFYKKNEIGIAVRVNIDNNNKDSYYDNFKFLSKKFPKAVIYPGIVDTSSLEGNCKGNESCNLNYDKLANFLIEGNSKHKGFMVLPFYPGNLLENTCIAETFYNYLIDPRGNLYKCWMDLGKKEKIIGSIHNPDKINNEILSQYLVDADPFNDNVCKNCNQLYLCGGGCPYKRLSEINKPKKNTCHLFKNNLIELLKLHYEYKISKKK